MADGSVTKYDAIIIPGGGLEPVTSLPQPWVRARLDEALARKEETNYFIVLSRGTTYRPPPTDTRDFPIDEAAASAKYLLDHGVDDPSKILMDCWSLDTIGNAYFARRMLCDSLLLRNLLVITSDFHMPRTRAIFDWVFALDHASFSLDYCTVTDDSLNEEQCIARMEKEIKSLRTLNEYTIPQVCNMEKLSQFLFQKHGAYNANAVLSVRPRQPKQEAARVISMDDSAVRSTY